MRRWRHPTSFLYLIGMGVLLVGLFFTLPASAGGLAQPGDPTPKTEVGGVFITVKSGDNPDINVRTGPGINYATVGKLLPGDRAPALGRTPGGDWVQIAYPQGEDGKAWVYAHLVTINGTLPPVEPPATPTPLVTPTIDPTLAAQFILEVPPTRLPTFTPPPPLQIPTFAVEEGGESAGSSTVVYAMVGLGLIGVFGMLLSFLRVR